MIVVQGKSGKACTNDKLYWAPYDLVGLRKGEQQIQMQADAQTQETETGQACSSIRCRVADSTVEMPP